MRLVYKINSFIYLTNISEEVMNPARQSGGFKKHS